MSAWPALSACSAGRWWSEGGTPVPPWHQAAPVAAPVGPDLQLSAAAPPSSAPLLPWSASGVRPLVCSALDESQTAGREDGYIVSVTHTH